MITANELPDVPSAIYDGLKNLSQRKPLEGLAKRINEEGMSAPERFGLIPTRANEMIVPLGDLFRAVSTSVYSSGGAFVGTDVGAIEPALRASSVCARAGARILTGLKNNLAIPLEKTVTTFSWLPEVVTVDATQTDGTAGQLNLSPNRLVGSTSISNQADIQTGGVLAQFLIESLTAGIGRAIDLAATSGSGVSGQPIGIFNRSGVSTVTFGAAATWAKLVGTSSFENQVLNSNLDSANLRWISHPNIKAKFKSVQRFSNAAETLWDSDRDYIGAHEAYTTTSVSSTTGLVCGSFDKLVIGFFGGAASNVRLIVNPYTNSLADRINFVVECLADVGVVRPEAFCIAADSAVQ